MNNLQFRRLAVAHQIGLENGLPVLEVLSLAQTDDQIQVKYIADDYQEHQFSIETYDFINKIKNNHQALFIVCEFKKELKQYVLISREMCKSLGLTPFKDYTAVATCGNEYDYTRSLILANAVKYKNPIEQKAILYDWKIYEQIQGFQHYREKTFHTYYYNRSRDKITMFENDIVTAYERFDYSALDQSMQHIENIDRVLPLLFVYSMRRTYLELIRNWITVKAEVPNNHINRAVEYINYFHVVPFTLRRDSDLKTVKNALSYFV